MMKRGLAALLLAIAAGSAAAEGMNRPYDSPPLPDLGGEDDPSSMFHALRPSPWSGWHFEVPQTPGARHYWESDPLYVVPPQVGFSP